VKSNASEHSAVFDIGRSCDHETEEEKATKAIVANITCLTLVWAEKIIGLETLDPSEISMKDIVLLHGVLNMFTPQVHF
jgi:hypothetical protein